MQTRLNLADSAAIAIDRSAASAVPHRLLVFVASGTDALKNPSLITAATEAVSAAVIPSERNHSAAADAAAIAALPTGPAAYVRVVNAAPADTAAAVTEVAPVAAAPDAAEGGAKADEDGAEAAAAAVAAEEKKKADAAAVYANTSAAAAALYVYKDTTLRSIVEALLESDPVAFLESLLNIQKSGSKVDDAAAPAAEEAEEGTAAPADGEEAADADADADADTAAAPAVVAPAPAKIPRWKRHLKGATRPPLTLDNIIRYAYQVVLPATLAQERHAAVSTVKARQLIHNSNKARRTEGGVVKTSAEGGDAAAADSNNNTNNNGEDDAEAGDYATASTVTSSTGASIELNSDGHTRGLANAHRRAHHPLFFLSNAIESFAEAEALAATVSTARRNRAIVDALSILSVVAQNASHGLLRKDFVTAVEVLRSAGLPAPHAPSAQHGGKHGGKKHGGAAAASPVEGDDAAEKKADGEAAAEPAAATEAEATTTDAPAEAEAEADTANAAASPSAHPPLADYLARASISAEKVAAIAAMFTAAKADTRNILRAAGGNNLQFSHVFPNVSREPTSAPIHKVTFCPDSLRVGGGFTFPSAATEEDTVVAAIAALVAGRGAVSLHDREKGTQMPHTHGNNGRNNNNNNNKGVPARNVSGHAAAANFVTAKAIALSELMNPQGFDFRFGDALIITPAIIGSKN